jgi:hypothetical protein
MKVQCRTKKGGSVQLSKSHGVWASYAVAGVADLPRPEILYAGMTLPNGRQVQFFANRESGLVVVDIMTAGQCGGNEVLRLNANAVPMPG